MRNVLEMIENAALSTVKEKFPEAVLKKQAHVNFEDGPCPCYIRFDLGTNIEERRMELLEKKDTIELESIQEMKDVQNTVDSIKNLRRAVSEVLVRCLDAAGFTADEANNGGNTFKNYQEGWKVNLHIEHSSLSPDWFSVSFMPSK